MQTAHALTKIRSLQRQTATNEAADELFFMEQLAEVGGDEFVEDLIGYIGDARTVEGGTDERTYHRGVCRAGFGTAFRY